MFPQIEVRLVAKDLLAPNLGRGRGLGFDVNLIFEVGQLLFNLRITIGDQSLIIAIGCRRLAGREQMLLPVISHQSLDDGALGGLDSWVAQLGQRFRIALSGECGVQNTNPLSPVKSLMA